MRSLFNSLLSFPILKLDQDSDDDPLFRPYAPKEAKSAARWLLWAAIVLFVFLLLKLFFQAATQ
jgi:hypothetical protein